MKVFEVQEDTIWLQMNNYMMDRPGAWSELNIDSCYTQYTLPYTPIKLDSMFSDGTIIDVIRINE